MEAPDLTPEPGDHDAEQAEGGGAIPEGEQQQPDLPPVEGG